MRAAFISEFVTAKNVLLQSVVIYLAMAAIMGVAMQSLVAVVASISAMTPFLMLFTFCTYDSMNGWERFRATLPVSRAAIVASRYANVLLSSLIAWFVGWAGACLLGKAAGVLPFPEDVAAGFAAECDPVLLAVGGIMGLSALLVAVALFLPFIMRFGLTKATRIVPVVFVLLIPVFMALAKQVPDMAQLLASASAWLDANIVLGGVAMAAIALAMYAVSCAISVVVYRTKEL